MFYKEQGKRSWESEEQRLLTTSIEKFWNIIRSCCITVPSTSFTYRYIYINQEQVTRHGLNWQGTNFLLLTVNSLSAFPWYSPVLDKWLYKYVSYLPETVTALLFTLADLTVIPSPGCTTHKEYLTVVVLILFS